MQQQSSSKKGLISNKGKWPFALNYQFFSWSLFTRKNLCTFIAIIYIPRLWQCSVQSSWKLLKIAEIPDEVHLFHGAICCEHTPIWQMHLTWYKNMPTDWHKKMQNNNAYFLDERILSVLLSQTLSSPSHGMHFMLCTRHAQIWTLDLNPCFTCI